MATQDVSLGSLTLQPGRQLLEAGHPVPLGRKPLEILSALAGAAGALVTKDELMEAVWPGRVVEENAIQAHIVSLRKALGGEAERLKTVHGFGYRLEVGNGEACGAAVPATVEQSSVAVPLSANLGAADAVVAMGQESLAAPLARPWFRASRLLPFALAAATVLGTTSAALSYRPPATVTIAVGPVASASGGRVDGFVDDLSTELARLASPMPGLTFVEGPLRDGSPDLLLRVSLGQSANGPDSHVRLVDGDTGAVIWSRDFEAQGVSTAALRERIAYAVAGVIHCGLDRTTSAFAEPVSRRLYLSACEAVDSGDYSRAHSYAEQIVALRPDAAASWACLAFTTIHKEPEGSANMAAAANRAMRYARHALDLDPRSGMAHAALAQALQSRGEPSFSALEKGMSLDPDHASLQVRYADKLMQAGYVDASIEPIFRTLALAPHYTGFSHFAFLSLLRAGRHDEAIALHRQMDRLWRDEPQVARQRAELLFYRSDPAAALAEFNREPPAAHPAMDLLLEELRWRADPQGYDWARFDRLAERQFAAEPDAAWYLSYAATRMQDQPRALAWLDRGPATRSGAWSVLFATDAAELRRNPRFFARMADLGLVTFWRERNRWPDFCSDKGLRYDCRQEARRLAVRSGTADRAPL